MPLHSTLRLKFPLWIFGSIQITQVFRTVFRLRIQVHFRLWRALLFYSRIYCSWNGLKNKIWATFLQRLFKLLITSWYIVGKNVYLLDGIKSVENMTFAKFPFECKVLVISELFQSQWNIENPRIFIDVAG